LSYGLLFIVVILSVLGVILEFGKMKFSYLFPILKRDNFPLTINACTCSVKEWSSKYYGTKTSSGISITTKST
jgi:hypothetical protein